MSGCSTYLQNKINDHINGVAAYTMPTPYMALFYASAGQSPRSQSRQTAARLSLLRRRLAPWLVAYS